MSRPWLRGSRLPKRNVRAEPMSDTSEAAPLPRFLAVDLGERHLAAGIVAADGTMGIRDRVVTPSRDPLDALLRLLDRVLAATPDDQRPVACAVSGPGPVDAASGEFRPIGMVRWHGLPIRKAVAECTGVTTMLESSGRAYAVAAAEGGSVLALHLGDQVDGGVVVDGALIAGANGRAGMFGHLLVEPNGPECSCGAVGCLEVFAGVQSIMAQTGRELISTPAALMDRAGIMVGRACASLAAMVDVRRIVVGGVLIEVFRDRFVDQMRAEFEERCRLSHLSDASIRVVQHHVLTGAAMVARTMDVGEVAQTLALDI